jgi:pimeloyl-ACP methyl ester carboxylesterase
MSFYKRLIATLVLVLLLVLLGVGCLQRKLLYFPSHEPSTRLAAQGGLVPWECEGSYAGYARLVERPERVWLFTHGNGGQAAQRGYALHCFSPRDSVYVLEYPGYGDRPGELSRKTFDAAAEAAFRSLCAQHGADKVCVLGESLGSGPASHLGSLSPAPRRIVLVVPFAVLTDVAQEQYPLLPVRLLMLDRWDNIKSLAGYKGRLDIHGAIHDRVIPVEHARRLAAALPGSHYHEFDGDHGWARGDHVDLSGSDL